ncbi:Major intrinsic protein, partial [Dillenia turbinata]
VLGSIMGVRLLIDTFPSIGRGPSLNVDLHRGALTEGILTFTIVIIYLGLARKIPSSFFMKTWISSVSKATLHILGSDLTGGCMNPASAMGWAYVRGNHISKEHILVYWLAPIEGTLLAIWTFKLLVQSQKDEK